MDSKAFLNKNYFNYNSSLTNNYDTIPAKNIQPDTAKAALKNNIINSINKSLKNDTIPKTIVTADTFNIQFSKDSLDAPVERKAIDSAVFMVKDKLFLLYGKAKTSYSKNDIDADFIKLDNKREILFARGLTDSSGKKITQQLTLKTTEQSVTADSILYNIKTGQALSHNSRTTAEEMHVQSKVIKLLEDKKSFYGLDNRFTTCNLDEPHFCFHAKKVKVIANDIAVSGFANPEFEGVPLPIGIPFGLFPLRKGKRGGLLPPQFTANEDLGIGLEGLGYYFSFKNKKGEPNSFFDLTLRTNLYSYGSWNAIITPTYRKRYKYNGSLNLNIQNTRFNFKNDADFLRNRSFNIGWSHSADTRARPGVSFSANVNAGKSSFNTLVPNNPGRNIQNQMNSSISWSKTWQQKLFNQDNTFNLTTSANHNQNTQNNTINFNLPEVVFSIQNTFPFKRKNNVGTEKWYEKIGFGYNGSLRSQFAFIDTDPIKEILRTIKDTFQWGASHNIPITMALPPLGPLQLSPSVTYEERTYGQKIFRDWNNTTKKVDTSYSKGIFQARQMGFGLSAATALFGTYQFKSKRIIAARHIIRPTASINYTPNMNRRNYKMLQVDTFGYQTPVSVFDGNLYGPLPAQEFGGISFGIDNNIELKVRKKKDTTESKVRIIDGFGISSAYNFLADSFQLAPFNINLRSTLFEGKLNITAGAIVNPYQVNAQGRDTKEYVWKGQKFGIGSFGRLTSANLALSTQFRGGDKDKSKDKNNKGRTDNNTFIPSAGTNDMTLDEQLRLNEYINQNPAEFVDFNIPWDVNLSVAINYSRIIQPDYSFKGDINASVNFNGNFSLTPKWKCGGSGFYDFKVGKIQQVQMFITREMHCWQLAINLVPIGQFRSFNITINPKAGILRDLRINRTRFFYGE